eukprot:1004956_1
MLASGSAYSAYPSHPPPIMDKSHSIMLLQDTTAQIHTTTHMTDAAQIHSTNPHRWYHTHHYVSGKLDQLNLDFSCELEVELCEFKKAVVYYSLHQRRSVKEKRLCAFSFQRKRKIQRENQKISKKVMQRTLRQAHPHQTKQTKNIQKKTMKYVAIESNTEHRVMQKMRALTH